MYHFLQVGFDVSEMLMTQYKYPEMNYGQSTVKSDQRQARTSQLDAHFLFESLCKSGDHKNYYGDMRTEY